MASEPVGLAQDLTEQRVMRAQVGDQDLAIWRSESSKLQAWSNRCPHRGMRLSHGFVRGESLACAYHGWHYNCEAACHYIPAHPELTPPETIKVQTFGVLEKHGVLWVNVEDTPKPTPLPDNCFPLRSITIHVALNTAIETSQSAPLSLGADSSFKLSDENADASILTLTDDTNHRQVLMLFQQSGDVTVTCHILMDGDFTTDELIKVSRWSESVRRLAESSTS